MIRGHGPQPSEKRVRAVAARQWLVCVPRHIQPRHDTQDARHNITHATRWIDNPRSKPHRTVSLTSRKATVVDHHRPLPGYRARSTMSLSRSATTSCSRLKPRLESRTACLAMRRPSDWPLHKQRPWPLVRHGAGERGGRQIRSAFPHFRELSHVHLQLISCRLDQRYQY